MNRTAALASIFIFLALPTCALAEFPDIHGFAELGYGVKVSDDTTKRDNFNYLEQRLQLKYQYFFEGENYFAQKGGIFNVKGDSIVDEYNNASTDFELREANLSWTPFDFMDVKLGRQVLTWGTGDYLFINDMFPKDYVSFYIGREDEYLKKPSDAVKMSLYPKFANIDFVVIPYFTPNTIAEGDRVSFFDSFEQGIAGRESERRIISPSFRLSNNEYALRIYRNLAGNELAFYYFRGFDKNPRSYHDEAKRELFYERLDIYGASVRGQFAGGIGNIETGYQYSREDTDGTNRLVENSMLKVLAGYTKDLGNDWKIGFQYLFEQKMNYDDYENNLLAADYRFDEFRHLLTNRITKLFKNQTVTASLFTFYSPSDHDGYVRPSVDYKVTDQWNVACGANLPWGEDYFTEFGGFRKNKNVYMRVRYNF
ncbi:MAG: hypothetical protein ABIJ41_02915 [Candidatus Omnitrophota bacterium]